MSSTLKEFMGSDLVRDNSASLPADQMWDGPPGEPGTRVLFGRSPAMAQVLAQIRRLAAAEVPILITGETGTGKELVARAIHARSRRASRPFVAFHAGAGSEASLEADLFGQERQSASQPGRHGRLRVADSGVLFLDEVGDLPDSVQVRLLNALERGRFVPQGGSEAVPVDVRVMATTGKSLEEAVEAGRFRADLYLRLTPARLEVPPLRDRREDIPLLAHWILERQGLLEGRTPRTLGEDAVAWLVQHPWPGNVRELEHALLRASQWSGEGMLRARDFLGDRQELKDASRPPGMVIEPQESYEDLVMNRLRPVVRRFAPALGQRSDLYDLVVGTTERALFTLALERTRGNQIKAAELLGINRNTLKAKLTASGIPHGRARRGRKGSR